MLWTMVYKLTRIKELFKFQLALYVLSFLEPRDLLVAAQTCRYWRILAEDDLMWREKCQEEGISDHRYARSSKSSMKAKKGGVLGIGSSWKAAFLRQVRVENNWRTGSKKPSKVSQQSTICTNILWWVIHVNVQLYILELF